jgi:xylulokinase
MASSPCVPNTGTAISPAAIMESIAAELSLLLGRLCGGSLSSRLLSSGGGSRSDLWLQIKADVTGCTLVTTGFPEAACAGAAMLAACAAGWFSSPVEASSAWVRVEKTFAPDPGNRARYQDWLTSFLRLRP